MIRAGIWLYVWSDRPAAGALDGFAGGLVRAANGDGTVSGSTGYDFAASWRAWAAAYPGQVLPWTYIYPDSTGGGSARTLFEVCGTQPVYQVDLEDNVPAATVKAFCDTMRTLAPSCKLVFDSYPSRRQFGSVNGTTAAFDAAIACMDAFNPQVYYSSQARFDADADGIPDYVDDAKGKPVLPALSVSGADPLRPASWPDVLSSGAAQQLLDRFGTLALWRYPDARAWAGHLTYQGDQMTQPTDWTAASDTHVKALIRAELAYAVGAIQGTPNSVYPHTGEIETRLAGLAADEDAQAAATQKVLDALTGLPDAVVAKLPPGSLSADAVRAAVEAALPDVRLSLDKTTSTTP